MLSVKKYIKQLYQTILQFLRERLSRVQFIMIAAAFTGLISGLMAVLLKTVVHYLQHWIEKWSANNFVYLLFPTIGLLITVFIIRRFFGNKIETGIAMVLRSIARRSSLIPFRHTYQHVITSSVTVGLGGSVGLESPIVATGSAIGSNISRISALSYSERTLLIACGATAGIAAAFNAPVAGLIFAIEVLLAETIISYFIPLIISSVTGVLCSKIILKESILFNFTLKQHFNYNNTPFYLLLGIACGFVSLYYARMFKYAEHRLKNWPANAYVKVVTGGAMLVLLFFLFPPLFGEGYESIKGIANGGNIEISEKVKVFTLLGEHWGLLLFTLCIFLLKPLAAAITIGAGGNGGNFAPSLFTGAYLGFTFSRLINTSSWFKIPEGNFSLVGMAGVLSGVMYAPLTAIFLIAELTNGYELFIPLMLVSCMSFFIVKTYEPFSMDTKKLALEGEIFTHDKEKNILTSLNIGDILLKEHKVLKASDNIKVLIDIIKKTEQTTFAVENSQHKFIGIVELHDIKQQLLDPKLISKTLIHHITRQPASAIQLGKDNMYTVMEKFDKTQNWLLPVMDADRKFIGFASKHALFNKYRQALTSKDDLYE